MSPASEVIFIDMSSALSDAMPIDFSIAPIVPEYCFAESSETPKAVEVVFAHEFIFSELFPKVTSTTFCTSVKSEPNSMHSFENAVIAFIEKAAAASAPIFFNAGANVPDNWLAAVFPCFTTSF